MTRRPDHLRYTIPSDVDLRPVLLILAATTAAVTGITLAAYAAAIKVLTRPRKAKP